VAFLRSEGQLSKCKSISWDFLSHFKTISKKSRLDPIHAIIGEFNIEIFMWITADGKLRQTRPEWFSE
jgi:hypothetical protein